MKQLDVRRTDTPTPYRDDVVRLADGRKLAFAEIGDPRGEPVFWFHGTPGGRTQIPPDAPGAAARHHYRIIGVDRPGVGGSSFFRGATLRTFADDVVRLADALGLARFAAVGLSGGGPYVLSLAHDHPDRLAVGVSLGGVGPTDGSDGAPGFPDMRHRLAMKAFAPLQRPLGVALSVLVQPLRPLASPAIALYSRIGPRSDRAVFRRAEMKKMFTEDIVRATKWGVRGFVHDIALFCRPWGFSPRDIRVPIRFFHGDDDLVVPLNHSEHLASIVPDSDLVVHPGLGHFAGFCHAEEVFGAIRAAWRASADRFA